MDHPRLRAHAADASRTLDRTRRPPLPRDGQCRQPAPPPPPRAAAPPRREDDGAHLQRLAAAGYFAVHDAGVHKWMLLVNEPTEAYFEPRQEEREQAPKRAEVEGKKLDEFDFAAVQHHRNRMLTGTALGGTVRGGVRGQVLRAVQERLPGTCDDVWSARSRR